MLPEVTQSGEKFGTSFNLTFKSGPIVYSLVSFKSVKSREVFVASVDITFEWTVLGVHPDVDLEAV